MKRKTWFFGLFIVFFLITVFFVFSIGSGRIKIIREEESMPLIWNRECVAAGGESREASVPSHIFGYEIIRNSCKNNEKNIGRIYDVLCFCFCCIKK
jgi:hypothetical protein